MLKIIGIDNIGEIKENDNLGDILENCLKSFEIEAFDVLVVTQKIVSKAEGRMVFLNDIVPSERAIEIANKNGKDARLIELVLSQSSEIIRSERGVLITRHKLGHVMANAGIDCSNLGDGKADHALLLPLDPDKSAQNLADILSARFGVNIGVVISDSFGRPWRQGVVNVAVGCAGIPSIYDKRGEIDRNGRVLQSTLIAYGDLIASAAGLVMGEGDEGIPVALIKGLSIAGKNQPASAIIRPINEDLFK